MFQRPLGICLIMAMAIPLAAAPKTTAPGTKLSAADIVDKNVAARGGLQAWRAVQTMTFSGKLGAGGNQRATLSLPNPAEKVVGKGLGAVRPAQETELPFIMDLKRPHKMRFELKFEGKTALQVFDGANGWKLRPYLNRLEVEPYTANEKKLASMESELDGPLVDYAAKGTSVELDGIEKVDGRDAYKLKLTMKDGHTTHVWVDAQTFLETKIEGQPRRLDGTEHPVEIYFSDYRPVDGLQIPFVIETKVLPVVKTALGFKDPPVPVEKITIEKVLVNPKIEDALFQKPAIGSGSRGK